jgi:hypothetical protein
MLDLPTGTLTFLFTDVECITALLEQDGTFWDRGRSSKG